MAYPPRAPASSSRRSTDTPPKFVPSFDHLVTQWMSHGTVSNGSRPNSSHLHSRSLETMPSIRRLHASVSTRGVGPAVSTGNPGSAYWPGGRRCASSWRVRRRPVKPRETKAPGSSAMGRLLSREVRGCAGAIVHRIGAPAQAANGLAVRVSVLLYRSLSCR